MKLIQQHSVSLLRRYPSLKALYGRARKVGRKIENRKLIRESIQPILLLLPHQLRSEPLLLPYCVILVLNAKRLKIMSLIQLYKFPDHNSRRYTI
ncbi:hypothetical protein D3C78_1042570 [compost metagenome]